MKIDKQTRIFLGFLIVALPAVVTSAITGRWLAPIVCAVILYFVIAIIEIDIQRRF